MEDLKQFVGEHPFFKGLLPSYIDTIVGCASNARFNPGQYLFKEGQDALTFYLIRQGKVSVEIFVPNRGPLTIETVGEGDVLGWSWLFAPYRWHFDARAIELTRAVAMDAKCLIRKKDLDVNLGLDLMQRFARLLEQRLHATRKYLVDAIIRADEKSYSKV